MIQRTAEASAPESTASLQQLQTQDGEPLASGDAPADRDQLLRTIADALPALIAYVGHDERYLWVNATYERWFGTPAGQVVNKHLRDVLGDAAYEAIQHHVSAALAGTPVSFQCAVPYLRGGERFIEASYVPDRGSDGRIRGYVSLVTDVTERRRIEEHRRAAAQRDERLLKITAAIADAITHDQVYEAVVDQVAAALRASSAALWLLQGDGRAVKLGRSLGYSDATRERFDGFALDTADRSPVADALRGGEPIWMDSRAALLERYPHLAPALTPGRSYRCCALPLIVHGRTLGAAGFTFDEGRESDPEERAFLLLVARYTGQALERLRLFEAERDARADAEAAADRVAVLSRVSRALSEAGQDLSLIVQALADQLLRDHADACVVSLVAGDVLEPVVAVHRDPSASSSLRALTSGERLRVGEGVTGAVAESGVPLFVPVVERSSLLAAVRPEHRAWLERHPPGSGMIVPLRARGRIIGTLAVARDARSPAFEPADLELTCEIAERAAMAMESSRLYRENQQGRLRAELLYGLAAKVIGAERAEQVFEAAFDAIERGLGAQRASILAFDPDGVMRLQAYRGLSEASRSAVEGHSPWSPDSRAPEPVLVPDVAAAPSMADFAPLFEREKIAALHSIPLVAASRLIGQLVVYYDRPRPLAAHELELATALANHVAAALNRFAAMAELQQTVRFNEMFAGVLGHDLRNPLSAIMTAAQLLVQRSESPRMAKPLTRILTSGARMARMIDQLLDFTRVRVGSGIAIDARPADLVALLRQAIDELDDANPGCSFRLEPRGDTRGAFDVDRLLQVFSNLLGNAVRHGVIEHGVTVRVDGTSPDRIEVAVHNAGAIPEALVPRLFEPMSGGERRHGAQGLGLGLYITREIVRAHGGRIAASSSERAGTIFSLSLPRRASGASGVPVDAK